MQARGKNPFFKNAEVWKHLRRNFDDHQTVNFFKENKQRTEKMQKLFGKSSQCKSEIFVPFSFMRYIPSFR